MVRNRIVFALGVPGVGLDRAYGTYIVVLRTTYVFSVNAQSHFLEFSSFIPDGVSFAFCV